MQQRGYIVAHPHPIREEGRDCLFYVLFSTSCFVNSCESERTATKVMIMGGVRNHSRGIAWHQTQKLI